MFYGVVVDAEMHFQHAPIAGVIRVAGTRFQGCPGEGESVVGGEAEVDPVGGEGIAGVEDGGFVVIF